MWKKIFLFSGIAFVSFSLPAIIFLKSWKANSDEEFSMKAKVKLGIEVLLEKKSRLLTGKKVGLITNITGVDSRLRSSVDLLAELSGVKLVALYGPEHGVRGGVQGEISHTVDKKTKLPVYSLFGATRRPTGEMLKDVEILVFDMQDIGSRSYTYISTMKLCLEEAAKNRIKFVVTDRPNPINGLLVDGPVLQPGFESFIGAGPIPYVHGMTIGELARFFNEELKINCALEVVPMEGWKRSMDWSETGLIWTPTSPNIPEPDSPWFYPVTGLIGELGLVSVGIGYTLPFKVIGAPWIDAEELASFLNSKKLPGIWFQSFYFSPSAYLFQNSFCQGCRLIITDKEKFQPVATSYHIIAALSRLYPEKFNLNRLDANHSRKFDLANGTDSVRRKIVAGEPVENIIANYQTPLKKFLEKRQKYLLYN